MSIGVDIKTSLENVKDQIYERAREIGKIKAQSICNKINYELSITQMEYHWNDQLADSDLIQLYDPDHAQLRISHLCLQIADIFHAELQPGDEDLTWKVVIASNDGREITTEMSKSLTMSINNALKVGE